MVNSKTVEDALVKVIVHGIQLGIGKGQTGRYDMKDVTFDGVSIPGTFTVRVTRND